MSGEWVSFGVNGWVSEGMSTNVFYSKQTYISECMGGWVDGCVAE